MKIKMVGSHLCQDTLYAMIKLKEKDVKIEFINISASFPALKIYLKFRDEHPLYKVIKEEEMLGLPFFILEDGTETLDLNEVLRKADIQ